MKFVLTIWSLGDMETILKETIFNLVLLICFLSASHETVLRWMLTGMVP